MKKSQSCRYLISHVICWHLFRYNMSHIWQGCCSTEHNTETCLIGISQMFFQHYKSFCSYVKVCSTFQLAALSYSIQMTFQQKIKTKKFKHIIVAGFGFIVISICRIFHTCFNIKCVPYNYRCRHTFQILFVSTHMRQAINNLETFVSPKGCVVLHKSSGFLCVKIMLKLYE